MIFLPSGERYLKFENEEEMKQEAEIRWPAKWFTAKEIMDESQRGDFVLTDKLKETLKGIDIIREIVDQPVIITDGCRWSGNEASQHYYRNYNAIDIWTEGYTSMELMKIVEEENIFTGRGLYPYNRGFIHVDTRNGLKPKNDWDIIRWWRDDEFNYRTFRNHYDNKPFEGWVFGDKTN